MPEPGATLLPRSFRACPQTGGDLARRIGRSAKEKAPA